MLLPPKPEGSKRINCHESQIRMISLEASLKLLSMMEIVRVYSIGRCGHRTQIQHANPFICLS